MHECETKEQSNRIGDDRSIPEERRISPKDVIPVESDRVNFIGATLRAVTTKCSPFSTRSEIRSESSSHSKFSPASGRYNTGYAWV
ncbi:hypothetical protein EVAR_99630_1 [Eumeta japonica]|uniref:Uncharacterized protein n=1 Tax=Eumeta variegata TaxID=151549 RepID=A0A4C1ZZK9_EUMVA|nr:hypothetical protein EVAR_99630_1 [Eumeta japonica]